MQTSRMAFLACFVTVAPSAPTLTRAADPDGKSSLDKTMPPAKNPPDWYHSIEVRYDTRKPWKEARLEIRRLLALGGKNAREAIKLTHLYRQKNDIGDGHEYPMYLFLGGEYAWALKAYEELPAPKPEAHTHAYLDLASCYRHFGAYDKARATLDLAMQKLPQPPWRIANAAAVHDGYGDLYVAMGDVRQAKVHYREAIRLYPLSKQPYGRHLLHRRAAKVQSKLDMFAFRALETGNLRDGTYSGQSLGFAEPLTTTVRIEAGRIVDINVRHKEKIDLGATRIIPQRIIKKQSLTVDTITGATVTSQAILDAAFQAIRRAERK